MREKERVRERQGEGVIGSVKVRENDKGRVRDRLRECKRDRESERETGRVRERQKE